MDAAVAGRATPATHLVIGIAPDGGRLDPGARGDVRNAIDSGLNVVSGLHDYLSEDAELTQLAESRGVSLHDVRKPRPTV